MGTFRERLGTAPLWVLFVWFTVVFGLASWAVGALLGDGTSDDLAGRLAAALVYGLLMTAFMAYRRRKDGGAAEQYSLDTAIRTGRLPEGADAAAWQRRLSRRRAQVRRARIAGPIVFGLFALGAAVEAATDAPRWWAAVALFVGFGGLGEIGCRRAEPRIERLEQQLASGQPAGA